MPIAFEFQQCLFCILTNCQTYYALGSTEHAEFLFNAEPKKSWDHQFSDNAGADKFFVKVHFASEFHSFRKQIFASADHQEFIASLGSCDPWQV